MGHDTSPGPHHRLARSSMIHPHSSINQSVNHQSIINDPINQSSIQVTESLRHFPR
jgi:hypothetical protein